MLRLAVVPLLEVVHPVRSPRARTEVPASSNYHVLHRNVSRSAPDGWCSKCQSLVIEQITELGTFELVTHNFDGVERASSVLCLDRGIGTVFAQNLDDTDRVASCTRHRLLEGRITGGVQGIDFRSRCNQYSDVVDATGLRCEMQW